MPEATHTIAPLSPRGASEVQRKLSEFRPAIALETNDDPENLDVIYVYNTISMEHIVEQPPLFPHMVIPACPKGQAFIHTLLPRYVNEVYEDYTRESRRYKRVDGRICATSLLNPAVHPRNPWEMQFREMKTHGDQEGNNLNIYGVFWSLTHPTDPKLNDELSLMKTVVRKTMNFLVVEGDKHLAAGTRHMITPRMHFAADYLKFTAPWHTSHDHMIDCPNCGENIKEGLAYHRNQFGERCILDRVRYEASVERTPIREESEEQEPISSVPAKPKRGRQSA
jgi:hypothetical protein